MNKENYPKQIEQLQGARRGRQVGARLGARRVGELAQGLAAGQGDRARQGRACPRRRCSSSRSRKPRSSGTSGRCATRSSSARPADSDAPRRPSPARGRVPPMLARLNDWITKGLLVAAATLAFLLCFLVVADVIGRVVFNRPRQGHEGDGRGLHRHHLLPAGRLRDPQRRHDPRGCLRLVTCRRAARRCSPWSARCSARRSSRLVCWGSLDPAAHAWTSNEFEGEGALRIPVVAGALRRRGRDRARRDPVPDLRLAAPPGRARGHLRAGRPDSRALGSRRQRPCSAPSR